MKNKIAFITLGLLSLSLTGCGTRMSVYPNSDKYLKGNQEYEQNIDTLDIDWISGSVTLVEDATIEGVKIEEETNLTNEKEQVHTYLSEGKLLVKYFASGHSCSKPFNVKKDLTITYKPGLKEIKIDLTSGSVKAETMTSQLVDVDITSGSVDVGTITSHNVKLDATSGSMKVDTLVSEKVKTSFTSGSCTINHVTAEEYNGTSTSGTYNIGFTGVNYATFDMTSGNLNMTIPEAGARVKVTKTSGNVVTQRECTIDNNVYTFGDGIADIKVTMTSGKVVIK